MLFQKWYMIIYKIRGVVFYLVYTLKSQLQQENIVFGAIPSGIVMFMKSFTNQFSQVVPHLNVFETAVGKVSPTARA